MSLAQTTRLLAGGGETARLSVLVHWVDDPVDTGILADSSVHWVDEDDFEVFCTAVNDMSSLKA